jgi:phage baseplate assembly protein W
MNGADPLLGCGLAVPLIMSPIGLAESAGDRKVEESIRIILGTQRGERVMRPQFGCGLSRLNFAPNDAATGNLARYYVVEGLDRWEPRIEVVAVDVANDLQQGRLVITIGYRVRATGDLRTLVYPFSLEQTR